jgi:uncharacterized membrane protein
MFMMRAVRWLTLDMVISARFFNGLSRVAEDVPGPMERDRDPDVGPGMAKEAAMARTSLVWAGLVGFGLSGFFDGILLHQVLQWHHLLSLVPGVESLRAQVVWDGLFHVLMYALTGLGLWGLWRAHRVDRLPGARALLGGALLGFGIWHFIDLGVFHWLLEIHHIRLDVPNPVAWDLGWFVAFGILPALVGWAILRRGEGNGGAPLAAALAVLAVSGGAWAWRGPEGGFTAVALLPGTTMAEVVEGLVAADAFLVGGDVRAGLIVVEAAQPWRFYGHGALFVTAGMPAGCLAWSEA